MGTVSWPSHAVVSVSGLGRSTTVAGAVSKAWVALVGDQRLDLRPPGSRCSAAQRAPSRSLRGRSKALTRASNSRVLAGADRTASENASAVVHPAKFTHGMVSGSATMPATNLLCRSLLRDGGASHGRITDK